MDSMDKHGMGGGLDRFSCMRVVFAVWAVAMRVLAWRQGTMVSGSGGTA